jgi:hypothetical protein
MKYLVVLNGATTPADFRKEMIDTYTKKYPLTSGSVNVIGDKVSFGNLALNPDRVMIINGALTGYTYDDSCYLSSMGYTVDDIPMINKMCENKLLLFRMLRDMDAPIQQCFSKPIKDQRYNIVYAPGKCSIEDTTSVNNIDGKVFQPWHRDMIEGYTLYYYLYKPIIIAKTLYRSPYNYAHLSQVPDGLFFANSVTDGLKDRLSKMPNITSGFLEQLSKVMYRLQIASGEIMLGWSETGIKIIDINPTHYPSLARFATLDLTKTVMKRFIEYMELE